MRFLITVGLFLSTFSSQVGSAIAPLRQVLRCALRKPADLLHSSRIGAAWIPKKSGCRPIRRSRVVDMESSRIRRP